MKKSESIVELAKALSQFQGEVKQPKTDKTNPFFKTTYVDLAGVVTAISETATKYGLSFIQFPINDQSGRVGVMTMIMHSSGEYIETEPIYAMPSKQDPQAIGSAITYLKRYSLAAAFGITSEVDDDGEASVNHDDTHHQQYQQQPNYNQATPQYQQQSQQSVLITEPQMRMLYAKLKACGGSEEQMGAIYANALQNLGIAPGTSRKDLTKQQASKVIDYIASVEPVQF